ncbi:hypothetical protein Ccrd_008715, partial [Cynara cardunculus var. scolymus]
MKMKRSRSEVFGLRRVRLPHILFLIAALYLIVVCFKFPAYFETSSTPDNEAVKRYQLEVSKPSLRSAYKDEISEALENDNRFERVPQQEKNLEEKPGDNLRESPLEDGNRLEKVSQQEKEASFPPLDRRYGRLTGNILRQRHRTRDMSGLEKMADEAWTLGGKAWEEVLKYHEKDAKLASILEGKQERCPPWVSVTGAELTKGDRIMFLPCGLAAGSSITVVGTPHHAHSEYVPQLAKLKMGNPLVLVSQFKVELQGLKSVVAEDPPKILHLNPRLRGDWSHQPVIEHNTCYRMQWGAAQRCDGLPSKGDDDMLVDGFPRCEKWMRNDVVDSKESRTTTWFKRFVGRAQKPEVTWPFPFVEGKLFVLTIRAGVDGYHINVGGRHVTSFPYRTGFTLEDATGLSIKGDVEVHSVFATSLPTSHPSFSPQRVIEMSEKWKSKPLPHHPVLVFIGILSATNHFAERMAIRKTWMQSSAIKASNVVVRFFVALSPRREQNAVLKKEADYFGDIVILTFVDHYELVEWPESVYPPYANGPGYIISSDIAKFVVSQRAKRKLRFNSTTTVRYSHHGKFCQYGCMDNYYTAHYQSPRQM